MNKAIFALPLLLAGCLSHPPAPPAPYLAKGHAPEWSLIIDDRNVTFISAGAHPIVQPTPPVIHGIAGEIYQTPQINVNVVHGQCTDALTGRNHHDRVQVDVGGKRYEGCGGDDSGMTQMVGLAGTSWRIVALNGRPTPGSSDYSLSFDSARLTGQLGCNRFSGTYAQSGERVDTGPMAVTRMACLEPAMSFESDGLAVLSQDMTMSWNGTLLTLGNGAGSIELSRSS